MTGQYACLLALSCGLGLYQTIGNVYIPLATSSPLLTIWTSSLTCHHVPPLPQEGGVLPSVVGMYSASPMSRIYSAASPGSRTISTLIHVPNIQHSLKTHKTRSREGIYGSFSGVRGSFERCWMYCDMYQAELRWNMNWAHGASADLC